MEHPHDPYHVRPFPQQPHRGGKQLLEELNELEKLLSDEIPDLEKLRILQERIHETANHFNDDRLIDMIRTISRDIDMVQEKLDKKILQNIITKILKIRIELKHL